MSHDSTFKVLGVTTHDHFQKLFRSLHHYNVKTTEKTFQQPFSTDDNYRYDLGEDQILCSFVNFKC